MKNILILLFAFPILFASCTNEKKYNISNQEKYEKGKTAVEEIEKKDPGRFLKVTGNSRKNVLQQTVVNGKIYNNAKVASYKDIKIKIQFYSKTGALLEEDADVVYESIHPGGSVSFKSKYFAPKGTDSVALNVTGAKF